MARYRQTPNYVARKTGWLAWDWWNIVIYITLIPALLLVGYFNSAKKTDYIVDTFNQALAIDSDSYRTNDKYEAAVKARIENNFEDKGITISEENLDDLVDEIVKTAAASTSEVTLTDDEAKKLIDKFEVSFSFMNFSWLMMLGLWAIVPITALIVKKKLLVHHFIFLWVIFPALFFVLHLVAPDLASSWLVGLGVWCVIPISIIITKYIIYGHQYVEFYDDYVVQKTGVFFKTSKKTAFPEVTGVRTYKNILGYGNVYIDAVGPWDVEGDLLKKIARPEDLREYLVDHMINSAAVENISNNPYLAALTAKIF